MNIIKSNLTKEEYKCLKFNMLDDDFIKSIDALINRGDSDDDKQKCHCSKRKRKESSLFDKKMNKRVV